MPTLPTIRRILSTLASDEAAKGVAMKAYKSSGASLDEFPRTRRSVEAMARGLTAAEDALELRRGAKAAALREALRPMRRALEL
jgi:hypothetical protein